MDEEGEATVWSKGLDEGEVVGVSGVAELSALAHFSLQRRVWRLRFEDTLKRRRQISHAQARTRPITHLRQVKRGCVLLYLFHPCGPTCAIEHLSVSVLDI